MPLKLFIVSLLILTKPFFITAGTPKIYSSAKPSWVTNQAITNYTPNQREIKDGFFLKQLEKQVNVEEEATYYRYVRQIVSETGIQNGSEISVSFDPTFERLQFHEIIVWRNNKPLNRLNLSKFKILADEKELSRFIYQGTFNAYLILDDIRKGDRIDFSYTLSGRNPIFGKNYSGFFYLQNYKPVSHLYTSIIASSGRNLKFKYFNDAPEAKKILTGAIVKYEWDRFNLKALYYEDNEPDWFDVCPFVEVSDYKDWNAVANWAAAINPPSLKLGGELSARITLLKAKYLTDQAMLFREAVKIVQDEVRYMGIEMGQYSHKANNPQIVFEQRFGDCKDKSLLLVSILKALNIKASLALLNSREKSHISKYIPSPQIFDHAVVTANVNGKDVWVDATSSNQGGNGAEIYFPDYGKALIVAANTTTLTDVPVAKKGKSNIVERYIVTSQDAPVTLAVESIYTLNKADDMRQYFASESIDKREKSYLDYYAGIYPKIKAIDTLVIKDDLENNRFTVIEKYKIDDFFEQDSVTGAYKVSFYASYISELLPKILPGRKHPIDLSYPNEIDYTCKVILPSGWNIETESKELRRKNYYYHSDYSEVNDTLSLHYNFAYLSDHMTSDQFGVFASDIKNLKNDYLEYAIIYTPDSVGFYPNYYIITFSIVLILGFTTLALLYYRQPTAYGSLYENPAALGGWLIVVMIALVVHIFGYSKALFDNKDFDLNHWQAFSSRSNYAFYRFVIAFETIINVIGCCFAVFCLFLLLKKRDIFPKTMLYYLIGRSVSITIFYILSNLLQGGDFSSTMEILYTMVPVIFWTQYIKTSDRIQQTFVVPYNVTEEEEELADI